MKERILKLCKRLNKFSLDEIATIVDDIDEIVLKLLLQTLVDEKFLIQQKETYFFNKNKSTRNYFLKLPKVFMYHSKEEIDLIIKCFCAEIPSHKAAYLVPPNSSCIGDFYTTFRKLIYENQYKDLTQLYSKNPQQGRFRLFFKELKAYFYIYNHQVYVSQRLLKSNNETNFTKVEIAEFKKIYCYLSRIESHNKHKANLCFHLAEKLWRRDKSFDFLYEDLKNLINC